MEFYTFNTINNSLLEQNKELKRKDLLGSNEQFLVNTIVASRTLVTVSSRLAQPTRLPVEIHQAVSDLRFNVLPRHWALDLSTGKHGKSALVI